MSKTKLITTLGSDPEMMLFDAKNEKMVSAIAVLKNDKDHPSDLGDGIKMYADNVLVECAFPPALSKDAFIETMRKALQRMVLALGPDYRLHPQAAWTYSEEALSDPRAWKIGCNPNFDAYIGRENEIKDFGKLRLRTGSCHIHIGNADWKQGGDLPLLKRKDKLNAIKLLDLFVGVPSVVFDKDFTAIERRKLYGKAGEFRPTPYGVEYRVLGNFVLRNPRLMELVLDLVNLAMDHIREGTADDVLKAINPEVVQDVINCGSAVGAQAIMNKLMPESYQRRCWIDYGTDLYKEWQLQTA